jgi:hypothetical protein
MTAPKTRAKRTTKARVAASPEKAPTAPPAAPQDGFAWVAYAARKPVAGLAGRVVAYRPGSRISLPAYRLVMPSAAGAMGGEGFTHWLHVGPPGVAP